ncbi:MAG: cupin [Tenericutes bacterium HGW-Tenericutes-1]|jgi:quercetin dioxygenase-like cupin family protein|nr:MAG: cupin [Tenericutes bacterium HGW-Tenericutes-1]
MVGNIKQLESKVITSPEAKDASIQVLVSPNEGWDSHVMRVLEVKQEGYTPKHSHPWPHINYIIEGEGELMIDGEINKVNAGSYAYVPSDTLHQFRNVGKGVFKFICIVPKEGHK